MASAFIVWANVGEYDDRREWAVAVYPDEAKATRHADLANAEEQRLLAWFDDGDNYEARYGGSCPRNAYDLGHAEDWHVGRCVYRVVEVPLLGAIPHVTVAALPPLGAA